MATQPKLAMIPSGYKDGKLYSALPTDGAGDFDVTRGSDATRINKDGLIETVSGNTPRLDYTGGGCPSLLLEPQRTNSLFYSQEIDNAYWLKSNCSIIANLGISPDGSLNADKLTTSVSATGLIYRTGITCGSVSFFAKDLNLNTGKFRVSVDSVGSAKWDKDGILSQLTGSATATDGISYGNGWFRFTLNVTSGSVVNYGIHDPTGSESILIYGVQNEPSSVFSSSYIPTSGSTQTRLADAANGAGNASTFNDSEGVLMANISALNNDGTNRVITIGDNSSGNAVSIRLDNQNQITLYVNSGGVSQSSFSANVPTLLFNKCLIKYKQNDFSAFVNGFKIGVDTSGSIFPSGTLNRLNFDIGYGVDDFYGKTKQLQYYNTALTDLELETLTSYTSFNAMALALNYTI